MGFGGDDIFGGPLSLGQFGYMAEAEGQDDLVDTPDARINAALNDMRKELSWARGSDVNIDSEVEEILGRHGIDPDELSRRDVARINDIIE